MYTKRWVTRFVISFAIALALTTTITYVWSLIDQGQGSVNWGIAVTLAFTLGAVSANKETRGRNRSSTMNKDE